MWIVIIGYLFVLSFFDIRSRKIPTTLLLLGSIFAVSSTVLNIYEQKSMAPEYMAALVPGVILLLLAFITGKIGYGDGWVIAMIGLLLGNQQGMAVFFISLFLSGITGILLLLFRKATGKTTIPYVPFVAIAVVLIWII